MLAGAVFEYLSTVCAFDLALPGGDESKKAATGTTERKAAAAAEAVAAEVCAACQHPLLITPSLRACWCWI